MYEDDDQAGRGGEEHDTNDSNITTTSSDSGSMIAPQNVVFYQAPASVPPTFPPHGQAPAVNGVTHDEMLKTISTQTQSTPQLAQTTIIPAAQNIPIAPAAASLPLPVEPVAIAPTEVAVAATIMAENNQYDADQSNGE